MLLVSKFTENIRIWRWIISWPTVDGGEYNMLGMTVNLLMCDKCGCTVLSTLHSLMSLKWEVQKRRILYCAWGCLDWIQDCCRVCTEPLKMQDSNAVCLRGGAVNSCLALPVQLQLSLYNNPDCLKPFLIHQRTLLPSECSGIRPHNS